MALGPVTALWEVSQKLKLALKVNNTCIIILLKATYN